MPNRILKESICTSDTLAELKWFEQVLFFRLIVSCDDYGRYDARPAIIKGKLFPLDAVTTNQISDALTRLSNVGIATLYDVDSRPYLQLCAWERHQQIRASKSKYPAPEENTNGNSHQTENICNQLKSDESKCPRYTYSYSGTDNQSSNDVTDDAEQEKEKESHAVNDERFNRFWSAYPRKAGKKAAKAKWDKLKPTEELTESMLLAIERQKKSMQWKDSQFIPHPLTWLNQGRWEDEESDTQTERKDDYGWN